MSAERKPQCVLGNGECPTECPIYENSAKITAELGDRFDPFQSRLAIVFGDAFNHDINVFDVARVMASCELEGKPKGETTPESSAPQLPTIKPRPINPQ